MTAAPNRIDAAPGTPEAAWQSWLSSLQLPSPDVTGWSSAVIVAAHPDDEVLGAGGMVAMLTAAGARIRLVAVTDGEKSDPGTEPGALARRRRAESIAALHALGAGSTEIVRLGLPDTGLCAAEGTLTSQLTDLCQDFDVCLAPWENDAHADHEAAGRAACRAHDRVLRYPVWMWHWATPRDADVPWDQALSVALPPDVVVRKMAAISAFDSQLRDRSGGLSPMLPAGFVEHFARQQEVFFG